MVYKAEKTATTVATISKVELIKNRYTSKDINQKCAEAHIQVFSGDMSRDERENFNKEEIEIAKHMAKCSAKRKRSSPN